MTERANRLTSRASFSADVGPPMSALQFRAFVDAFGRLGYDTAALLMASGLQGADLTDPDGLVPCSACGDFFGRARQMRPMANLGVRLAAVTPTGAFPLLDYLALTSD